VAGQVWSDRFNLGWFFYGLLGNLGINFVVFGWTEHGGMRGKRGQETTCIWTTVYGTGILDLFF
jgi:hypothetical protein